MILRYQTVSVSNLPGSASILLTASLGEVRGFGEAERRKREPSRGAAGAEGCEEGCPPPHWGRGLGAMPAPQKIFFSIFGLQIATS